MDKKQQSYIFKEGVGQDGREAYLLELNGKTDSCFPKIKFTEQDAYKMSELIMDAAREKFGKDAVSIGKVMDCTPTWQGILPTLLVLLEQGNSDGYNTAKQQLFNMAKLADSCNENEKHKRKALNKDNDDNYKMGLISEEDHIKQAAKINL